MQQKISEWERLESVIKWANMTTNYFARHIGLPRGENLYQIKKGNNGISRKIAMMISEKFPQINIVWLLTGNGEMFSEEDLGRGAKPFYNVGVEENIRNIASLEADSQLILPPNVNCDLGILYLGRAMGETTPTNTVLLLKNISPEMIIPGDECVIVTKKIVLLRIANLEEVDAGHSRLRLLAVNNEAFGDVTLSIEEIEAVYKVNGKILITN